MKLRYKILNGVAALFVVRIAALAITLAYESPCPTCSTGSCRRRNHARRHATLLWPARAPSLSSGLPNPRQRQGKLLIKVRAASVNPFEWHMTTGKPYLLRLFKGIGAPDRTAYRFRLRRRVESVGPGVTRFKTGDEVFGGAGGALAEYSLARDDGDVVLASPRSCRSSKPPQSRSPLSPRCRACAITVASPRGRKCSSMAPPAALERTPCRSRSLTVRKSPACAARATSSSCVRSARTASSTTPSRTSPKDGALRPHLRHRRQSRPARSVGRGGTERHPRRHRWLQKGPVDRTVVGHGQAKDRRVVR